ncbi:hypothetical protein [Chryseobacterium balustinum]|uniref:ORC-CDC6 family AAA ATPase n=1 Tax=Chryseobacterium balustinum TaxID=246 RepID=UPI003CF882F8
MNEIDYINSEKVKNAINKLANNIRTERSTVDNLLEIYADKSILGRLDNHNNQIIYGRRGTGKTHLLFAFQDLIFQSNNTKNNKRFPIYIDLRKYLPLFTSANTMNIEATILIFQAIINDTIDYLTNHLKYILDIKEYGSIKSFESSQMDKLKEILHTLKIEFDGRDFKRLGSVQFNKEEIKNISGSLKLNQNPEISLDRKREQKNQFSETNVQYLSFNEISKTLDELSYQLNGTKIIFLLDEWSEIPIDLQPYLAELIKRVFISSNYTFKIAAIPYRSRFRETIFNDVKIGLEEGGDIFPISLDNRYIYEIDKIGTKFLQ